LEQEAIVVVVRVGVVVVVVELVGAGVVVVGVEWQASE
jgi:hypothetical protein